MIRTLVVAAYPPELDGLAERFPDGRALTRAVGVGLVEASAGIERAIIELRPERVVLIGTAGRLPSSSLAIEEVAVVKRAHLVARDPEYLPGLVRTRVDADSLLTQAFAKAMGAPVVEALSTLGITLSDAEAERLSAQGPAQLEQLEVFAVLAACERNRIAATAVLAVANRVGSTGASEWRQHRASAEAKLIDAIARVL